MLEYYDMAIYAYLAPYIAQIFFPSSDKFAGLLSTFVVFAMGYAIRPLAAFIFGPYADKFGRKKALTLTIMMMGISSFVIGILPTYGQIGIIAPVLLVLARVAEGISAGGEWGSNTAFIVEYAKGNRGFWGSFNQISVGLGYMLASLVATILSFAFTPEAITAWAWRIPFILGIAICLVGIYLRRTMDDTPHFESLEKTNQKSEAPLREVLKHHPKDIFLIFGFTIHWTSAYFVVLTFMPTYLSKILGLPFEKALFSNLVVLAFFVIMIPFLGKLSDRIGRKPLLIISAVAFILLPYPLFSLMASSGKFAVILVCQLILAGFLACFSGPGPAAIAEITSTKVRTSALAIGYNLAVTGFGAPAPLIATYLVSTTGNVLSPTFFSIGCAVISLLVLIRLKETYKDPLK